MEKIVIQKEKLENMGKNKLLLSSLAKTIRNYSLQGWGNQFLQETTEEFISIYQKPLYKVETVEEFLNPKLIKALTQLEDQTFADNICDLVHIFSKGQFSAGTRRRSFHSSDFGFYAPNIIPSMRNWIRIYHCNLNVQEMLTADHDGILSFEDVIALEIRRENPYFLSTIREMIEGENNVLLSRKVILGIIKSGNQELLELLLKLLVAAGAQEGLRQSVLESADAGSVETFKAIYKCCMDHDLFRFSSAARALYTWSGFYLDKLEIKETRRIADLGWNCLSDKEFREKCLHSAHPFEMYFALWAMGCEEVKDTDEMAKVLINAEEKYKKYVGWHFIYQIQDRKYTHQLAIQHLDEDDLTLIAVVTDCLYYSSGVCNAYTYNRKDFSVKPHPDEVFPADVKERRELFGKLKRLALLIGRKETVVEGHLFPWSRLVINQENANVMRCMACLAAYDLDPVMIDELYELQDIMTQNLRRAFYVNLLDADHDPKHRQYLWNGLKDRSIDNKIVVVEKLKTCKISDEDVLKICEMLQTKSAKIKKCAVGFLKPLEPELRKTAIRTLLAGKENLVQVALELMIADAKLAEEFKTEVKELQVKDQEKKLSDDTKLLLEQLLPEDEDQKAEEGEELLYGLIDPKKVSEQAERLEKLYPHRYLTDQQIRSMYLPEKEVDALLQKMIHIFESHADYEYEVEDWDGGRRKILFGDSQHTYYGEVLLPAEYGCTGRLNSSGKARLDMVPFSGEFRDALKEYLDQPMKLAMLYLSLRSVNDTDYMDWFGPFLKKYGYSMRDGFQVKYKGMTGKCEDIISYALREVDEDQAYQGLSDLYFSLLHKLGEKNFSKIARDKYGKTKAIDMRIFVNLRGTISRFEPGDDRFAEHFSKMYVMERNAESAPSERGSFMNVSNHIETEDLMRAVNLGILSENELYDWILSPNTDNRNRGIYYMSALKGKAAKEFQEQYPWLKAASEQFLDKVVRFEAKRGQAETPITRKIRSIVRIEGSEYFCLLLKALGKENFFRGYSWSNDGTKAASLSSLLKKCWPAPDDTVEKLKALIKETSLTEKRLVEAAMYAPQWASYIEEIAGWKGLKKAIWLFHAHISERFSSEKETEVAIYSPITPQEFNDGVFDIEWFKESYEELGEKRFKQLYSFAKYITDGSNAHRRSQLYADACLGKLDAVTLEKEILEKRNQERLRAYALIPVKEEELLHRYEFIQKYIKDSRQFGAQRRESEKLAGNCAIQNLAISSGYMDVNRMLWKLENEKNESIRPLLLGQQVEGYEVALVIDEAGDAELSIKKAGKALKSVPKAIAKHELILELKQTVKELKDQKIRGRKTLEDAMINRTLFCVSELENVLASFTIAPMAKNLVWKSGDFLGYPVKISELNERPSSEVKEGSDFGLLSTKGEILALSSDAEVSVAHPHHLFTSGQWHDFMHDAFSRQLVQPFKQIFREYYPVTEEEKQEKNISRRYAGYQVQPKQTVGLLKGRGWTVDYEEGLQKVCYGDNLIVRMYAQADWFSPADIEAPTLEIVQFYDRKTGDIKEIEAVNPVTFSEVMRDLDLVVSVAYVGGVEIETSHSTVQMRIALAKEFVSLMKLKNVTFTDHHARIEGSLATYSVHMGSGIVHAGAFGMIPILPVHSQHRGRIFLPFADEDPRTAEIMSKIILLSEDKKIKDPEILKMLR